MTLFLSPHVCLKRLETPSVYAIKTDELYELDETAFGFLNSCTGASGCSSGETEFIAYCLQEGILTPDRVMLQRPSVQQSPVPSLRYLELQITDRCNLRCRHCYIGEGNTHELTVGRINTILQEFEEMQGLRILITGGEPLLHSRFQEINDMLPGFLLRKVLFSNGLLISERLLDTLRVDEIQISIDGLEHGHDALRGKGTFRKALDAIKLCLDRGFPVSVSTMVHAKNLADFDAMDRLFRKMGIRDWTVDVPCISGRLSENNAFQISPEKGGKYLEYGFGKGLHNGGDGYGCGLHLMSVLADGTAAKCTFYADRPAGSIHDGLAENWKKIRPVRLGELACDCSLIDTCRGGCRYRAELLGNATGKDLYRCALYGIMKTE